MNSLARLRSLLEQAHPRPWTYEISGDGVYIDAVKFGVTFGHYRGSKGDADASLIVALVNCATDLINVAETSERVATMLEKPLASAYDLEQAARLRDALGALGRKLAEDGER